MLYDNGEPVSMHTLCALDSSFLGDMLTGTTRAHRPADVFDSVLRGDTPARPRSFASALIYTPPPRLHAEYILPAPGRGSYIRLDLYDVATSAEGIAYSPSKRSVCAQDCV